VETRKTEQATLLAWRMGAHHSQWTATAKGHTYLMWKSLDGWWRVKVDGINVTAPTGTSTWGVKASAQDVAEMHARNAEARRSMNGGRA
jgi:hypothetical protein